MIVLLTAYDDPSGGLGGSEYMSLVHGVEAGMPPHIDLAGEKRLHGLILDSIGEGLFASCHDVSDGGLAVCLAECCVLGACGAQVLLNPAEFPAEIRASAILFGEAQGRAIVSLRTEKQFRKLAERASQSGVRATWIGTVGGTELRVARGIDVLVQLAIGDLSAASERAIPRRMQSVS